MQLLWRTYKPLDINTGRSICVILTKVWKIIDNLLLACVASVSNRVTARKLEREQKKKKVEGGGGGEKRKPSFLHSPPAPPSFLFFCSRPNFLDELARTRLLRRLTICKSIFLSPLSLISWLVLGYGRWEFVHFLARDFSNKLQRDVLWKLSTFSTCCWTDTEWRINVQYLAVKQLACSSWFHLSLEHFEVIWDDCNTQEKLKQRLYNFFLCRAGRGDGTWCFMGNAQVVNTMLKPWSNCGHAHYGGGGGG